MATNAQWTACRSTPTHPATGFVPGAANYELDPRRARGRVPHARGAHHVERPDVTTDVEDLFGAAMFAAGTIFGVCLFAVALIFVEWLFRLGILITTH